MSNKNLGLFALAGAPFFLLSPFLQPLFSFLEENQFYGVWGIIYLTAWMGSIIGLQRLKATGETLFGRVILWVVLCTLVLANISNLYQIVFPGARTPLFFLLDAFWPVSNWLMLIVGITVVAVRQLKGWRQFVPLVVGCWLPVMIVSMNILGRTGVTGLIGGWYSAVAWSLLAVVVMTTKIESSTIHPGNQQWQKR